MDERIGATVRSAVERLTADLRAWSPLLADGVTAWLRALARAEPADYFLRPRALPMLELPGLLDRSLAAGHDEAFQADLAYSTVSGYCFVRLIDNIVDGEDTCERELLPAAGFFHTQFQLGYQRYFPASHPFWSEFARHWFLAADLMVRERTLDSLDDEQFNQIAARKICAVKIPIAAVCYHRGRPDLIAPWGAFVDDFGRRVQLADDMFDFIRDGAGGRPSWFLSEAERRRRADEPAAAWIARGGFAWGLELLRSRMIELRARAADLGGPEVERAIAADDAQLLAQGAEVAARLADLAPLAEALSQNSTPRRHDAARGVNEESEEDENVRQELRKSQEGDGPRHEQPRVPDLAGHRPA